ncbi:putative NAD(P)H-flavin oxidoreductase [Staphylococcus piscifermentans]|uniref:Putative NAD(P)H nitroreductase n=1 Tax=Staphylococcus piscifermentans TaxID=70258 RepID=A0A239TN06_9STAP|nr:NAD(P)H-dependent oxidoreductase [Staphylococcus piscifermentans]RTX86126.1 NAD(P)H-dependent oxidoreductase [Staphylococcus piscifermentans]GEP84806.1 putative NAD(P)H nitroreductase [Staphylococcus piscifermentans]SNU98839.1 putative NAD(P)H-flavin oxidoreductase [Staphylococcus piscifermentans]
MDNKEMRQIIIDAFNFRHATKQFNPDKKVSDADFQTILEAGRLSPSSIGSEPWRFVVVQNEEMREKLREVAPGAIGKLETASHFVILLARRNVKADSEYFRHMLTDIQKVPDEKLEDMVKGFTSFQNDNLNLYESERSLWDWASKQTYIALGNMMTAAALLGVDSCPMEGFKMKELTKFLEDEGVMNSEYFLPSVMVAFGYRKEDPKRGKTRQSQDEVVEWVM